MDGAIGKLVAFTYTVEFQKRGLPHAHILAWLSAADSPNTADDYDRFCCAEIPDPNTHGARSNSSPLRGPRTLTLIFKSLNLRHPNIIIKLPTLT